MQTRVLTISVRDNGELVLRHGLTELASSQLHNMRYDEEDFFHQVRMNVHRIHDEIRKTPK